MSWKRELGGGGGGEDICIFEEGIEGGEGGEEYLYPCGGEISRCNLSQGTS